MANLVLGGGGGEAAAYTIDQSVRFEDGDSAVLGIMFQSTTSDIKKEWTFSCWVKRGNIGTTQRIFGSDIGGQYGYIGFDSSNRLEFYQIVDGVASNNQVTTQVFRDVGAWYHIVVAQDTDQSESTDRDKIYVNGSQVTAFGTAVYPSEGYTDMAIGYGTAGGTRRHCIGDLDNHLGPYDGYIAEVCFVTEQQLTPSSFAETDEDTNQWKPIDASDLTFGTNGFYLKFQDSSDFGDDSSGNNNDFAVTNLVATDQMKDSPTNNFSTFNLVGIPQGSGVVLSEGNLKFSAQSDPSVAPATISASSGKWYSEMYLLDGFFGLHYANPGVVIANQDYGDYLGESAYGWAYVQGDGKYLNNNTGTSYGDTYGIDDIIGVALDLANDNLYFSKNGTWQNSGDPTSGATGTGAISITANQDWVFAQGASASNAVWNFGSDSSFAGNATAQGNADSNGIGDFYYAPPTDYLASCTSNISDPSIKLPGDNFNTVLWTGTGGDRDFTGVGFQPDFLWSKSRDDTWEQLLQDSVRGSNKMLFSNSGNSERVDDAYGYVDSFASDGWSTVEGSGNNDQWNDAGGDTFVAWSWLAATTFDPATDGTIVTASGKSNASAGFSIVTYTGTGVLATVGHNLSAAPELVIIKNRTTSSRSWSVGSTAGTLDFTYVGYLNETNAFATDAAYFNDTDPSASVFTVYQNNYVNDSGDEYVAYCFHSVDGYSKVGSYIGNGNADGPFVYTGFSPACVILKFYSSVQDWSIIDNKRPGYNLTDEILSPNLQNVEDSGTSLDFLSSGFKPRAISDINNSSADMLYIAFAESPFKYANAR